MESEILKDENEWNNYIKLKINATVYHTLEWKKVMEEFGHKPYYILCKEKGEVKGVIPIFYVGGIFGKRLVSVSLRDRGGPLFDNENVLTSLMNKVIELCKSLRCDYIEIKSISNIPLIKSKGFIEKKELIGTKIPLTNNIDEIWKSMDKSSVRSSIKKAVKIGIKCRWSKELKDLNEFYNLFVKTRKKLGVPPYSYSFFKSMMEKMKDIFKLIVAEYEGKIISAAIIFAYNKTLIDAYAASNEKFLNLRPNNGIVWETIKLGVRERFETFDFGADYPSCKGLIAFKSRWGGIQKNTYSYFYLNNIKKIPTFGIAENILIKKIWQLMPIGLSKILGRYMTKQVS